MRIAVLLHGLTGGSNSNYMKDCALSCYRNGFRTVIVNMRGINSELLTPQYENFGTTEDL